MKSGLFAGAIVLLSSCAKIGEYAEKKADDAAYGNIKGAQIAGLGAASDFSLEENHADIVEEILAMDRRREEAEILSLSDTLAIAMANSRSYKFRKETMFIEALNLTEVQKDFNFNYNADAEVGTSMTTFEGGAAETFGERGVGADISAGVTRTLATGARISLDFSKELVSYFSNPDSSSQNGSVSFRIVQPLLRGFGPLVTKEPLRQAERDMVYEVRDFKRFQQDFVISIASRYYSTLQARDRLLNERKSYESAVANRERNDSMAKAGRIPDFQAAQTRLSELNAADSWTLAKANYEEALDNFRFNLGLPIDLNVEPDPGELEALAAKGLVELNISLDDALGSALSNRLDLVNARMRVEDGERKLEIQQREFLPDLDVEYQATALQGGVIDSRQELSVGLDLPFDWTERRNDYRVAKISLERQTRALEEREDAVKRDVRDLWRKLERNRSVYNNRLLSLKLSERTVEQTSLYLKQGKALTRDLLDAENDLLDARNTATLALVDFTINRMRFWDAIERFEIDSKGMWYERSEESEQTP